MYLLKPFALFLIFAVQFVLANFASAETVRFSGIVAPHAQSETKVIDQPGSLVSFSDQIALAFPIDFGIDGEIRVFNQLGDIAEDLKLLSLASDNGVKTQVAVVDLLPNAKQTFLLCDLNRCIRYKVVRY